MKNFLEVWKSEIWEMFQFLKNPHQDFNENLDFDRKIRILTAILLFEFVFAFLIVYPLSEFIDLFYHLRYGSEELQQNIYMLLLTGSVIVPLIEEVIFRLPLRYRNNYLFRFLDSFSTNKIFQKIWFSNYRIFFYLSAVTFGIIHIFNYNNSFSAALIILTPLIILSELLGGFTLGYVRVRIGFIWGFLLHFFWNFILILGSYLMYHNTTIINSADKDKTIKLTELSAVEGDSTSISYNIQGEKIYQIQLENTNIQFLLDLIAPNYHADDQDLINFELKSENGITKRELLNILQQEVELDSINN